MQASNVTSTLAHSTIISATKTTAAVSVTTTTPAQSSPSITGKITGNANWTCERCGLIKCAQTHSTGADILTPRFWVSVRPRQLTTFAAVHTRQFCQDDPRLPRRLSATWVCSVRTELRWRVLRRCGSQRRLSLNSSFKLHDGLRRTGWHDLWWSVRS